MAQVTRKSNLRSAKSRLSGDDCWDRRQSDSYFPPREDDQSLKMTCIQDYIRMARPDRWTQSVFLFPGALLGSVYSNEAFTITGLGWLVLAIVSTCLVASSNYTLNEWLDKEYDSKHRSKMYRPAAMGRIGRVGTYTQWLLLAIMGLSVGAMIGGWFFLATSLMFIQGILYNIKPLRTKEIVYLDVVTESVNSPIRFLQGWFAVQCQTMPATAILLAFWIFGAYVVTLKRLAELRHLGFAQARSYRRSFRHYTEQRLITLSMFFGVSFGMTATFAILQEFQEFMLLLPVLAAILTVCVYLSMQPDSLLQRPERLYRSYLLGMLLLLVICLAVCCVLGFRS